MAGKGFNELLLSQHLDCVYRYALRLTRNADAAAELTQETMLRAWRSRTSLKEHAAARAWLLRITNNTHNQSHRRRVRIVQLDEPPENGQPCAGLQLETHENLSRAMAALDALPDRQRRVMHLAVCEGLPQAEVAQVLGVTPQAVKASLSEARRKLRIRLSDIDRELSGSNDG